MYRPSHNFLQITYLRALFYIYFIIYIFYTIFYYSHIGDFDTPLPHDWGTIYLGRTVLFGGKKCFI